MLESAIQTKIKNKMQEDGWTVIKLIKTSMNGIPDILALKNGEVMFIEVKQPKGVVSPLQKHVIKTLREKGFNVKVWTNYNKDYEGKCTD